MPYVRRPGARQAREVVARLGATGWTGPVRPDRGVRDLCGNGSRPNEPQREEPLPPGIVGRHRVPLGAIAVWEGLRIRRSQVRSLPGAPICPKARHVLAFLLVTRRIGHSAHHRAGRVPGHGYTPIHGTGCVRVLRGDPYDRRHILHGHGMRSREARRHVGGMAGVCAGRYESRVANEARDHAAEPHGSSLLGHRPHARVPRRCLGQSAGSPAARSVNCRSGDTGI